MFTVFTVFTVKMTLFNARDIYNREAKVMFFSRMRVKKSVNTVNNVNRC